jgi:hypothetical protein
MYRVKVSEYTKRLRVCQGPCLSGTVPVRDPVCQGPCLSGTVPVRDRACQGPRRQSEGIARASATTAPVGGVFAQIEFAGIVDIMPPTRFAAEPAA